MDLTKAFDKVWHKGLIFKIAKYGIKGNLLKWLTVACDNKTVYMLLSSKMSPSLVPPIRYGNIRLQQVFEHKHIGLIFTPNLSWSKHIFAVIAKANQLLGVLKKNKYILSRKLFHFIHLILKYGDLIYDSCSKSDSE